MDLDVIFCLHKLNPPVLKKEIKGEKEKTTKPMIRGLTDSAIGPF
jgi:hypothetical protein